MEYIISFFFQSVGPSGRNCDYLFNFANSLKSLQVQDKHIFSLEGRVSVLLKQQQGEQGEEQLLDLALNKQLLVQLHVSKRKQLLASPTLVPKGTILVDHGAMRAVSNRGKSLLPVGIVGTVGSFDKMDIVWLATPEGKMLAKGISNFSAQDLAEIKGQHTKMIKHILSESATSTAESTAVVMDCNNLILL